MLASIVGHAGDQKAVAATRTRASPPVEISICGSIRPSAIRYVVHALFLMNTDGLVFVKMKLTARPVAMSVFGLFVDAHCSIFEEVPSEIGYALTRTGRKKGGLHQERGWQPGLMRIPTSKCKW